MMLPTSDSSDSDFSSLERLGLRSTAVACYKTLYLNGPLTAGRLAKAINKPRTSVYYALAQLERQGFVERNKDEIFHHVTKFRAIRLDKALENLAIYQRRTVQELVDYQIKRSIKRQAGLGLPVSRKDWR